MNIEIKKLTSLDLDDFIELISVFEDVFTMQNFIIPNNEYLLTILNKTNFFTLVAKADNKVVGGLTVYLLDQYYSEKPLAYIYDLAVSTLYQRQGIGKKLIEHLIDYCRENEFEEVFVQADNADDYAIDFYRSTNISNEKQVVHFYYALHKN